MKTTNKEENFNGISVALLNEQAKLVHKLLRPKYFTPDGHVQHGNMPVRPIDVKAETVETFHDGTVQLCLSYSKNLSDLADTWWLDSVPPIYCNVYVVFKTFKTKDPRVEHYDVSLGWEGQDPYDSTSKSLDKAYSKVAKKFNRELDQMFKHSYC